MRKHRMVMAAVGAIVLPFSSVALAGEPITPERGLALGEWADAVPIEAPPGPAGAAPSLAIVHAHTSTEGPLGSGFTLAGTSVITRHSETGGVPNLTVADSYRLDGKRLVLVATNTYEPERHDGTRLWFDTVTNTWSMKRDGWVWVFGSTGTTGANATKRLYELEGAGHQLSNPVPFATAAGTCTSLDALCNTAAWYLSQATDPNGNVLKYDWTVPAKPAALSQYFQWKTRERLLSKVTYANGNATIDLTYEERPDPRISVAAGTPTLLASRLAKVVSKGKNGAFFARYDLQYKDDETDAIGAAEQDRLRDRPIQSLLRRVVRKDSTGAASRTVRAYDTWDEAPDWGVTEVTSAVPAPDGMWADDVWSIPVPIQLDGDGVSDLLLLTYGCGNATPWFDPSHYHENMIPVYSCRSDHHAYVATPTGSQPFAGAASNLHAAAWEAEVSAHAGGDAALGKNGYAITDLDRDGAPDLMWADTAAPGVAVSFYSRATRSFTVQHLATTAFTLSDLRNVEMADVDGDGYPDAILRASISGGSKWIRNTGASPWLDRTAARTLELPLEAATPPPAWSSIVSASCTNRTAAPSGFTGTDAEHRAKQTRFVDMNGDGLTDAVVALHACWMGATPVSNTLYSRIFWGDGYGGFIDSGKPAGPAFLDEAYGAEDAEAHFGVADLDRDGHLELIQRGTTASPFAAYDRGLALGFGLGASSPYAASDVSLPIGRLAGGAPFTTAAFADFDGDGFPDILDVRLPTKPASANDEWPKADWKVYLHGSDRYAAQGRVVASHDAWGGTTELTWGFSASGDNDNPDLPMNTEVLAQVEGSEGTVKVRYAQGGSTARDGLTAFGLVERQNERGGSELFGFATIPAMAGAPTHAVRYRTDGSIESAAVYVNGVRTASGGWGIDLEPPYDNPVLRQCEIDLDFASTQSGTKKQSFDVSDLIRDCHAFGTSASLTPSNAQLLVGQGRFRYPPDAVGAGAYELAAAVWGRPETTADLVELTSVTESTPGRRFSFASPWTGALDVGLRWPVPAGIALPPSPLAPGVNFTYPEGTWPTARSMEATDWTYDATAHKLTNVREHQDTTTTADDRLTAYTYNAFDSAKWGRRVLTITTTDVAGAPFSRVTRSNFDPASFDHARSVESCGTLTTGCPTDQFTWGASGGLIAHTFADGTTESWTRAWCGDELTSTDQVGRVRTRTVDDRCLVTSDTWQGARTDFTYDDFLRETQRTLDPNGAGPNVTFATYRDDALAIAADTAFQEPRVAEVRGDGRATFRFIDDFGRNTRTVVCTAAAGTGNAADGVRASVTCAAGTEIVIDATLFGTDGTPKVVLAPFAAGETVRATAFTRDGAGRALFVQSPAHVAATATPSWLTTSFRFGPTWTETVDPLGVVERVTETTLSRTSTRAGVTRGSTALDAFGLPTSATAADGAVISIERDPYHRVSRLYRASTAPCLLANGTTSNLVQERSWKYDSLGRVGKAFAPDGSFVETTYDAAGRVDKVWHNGSATGTLLEDHDYVAATSPSTFAEERVTSEAGNLTTTTLDGFGRARTVTSPAGSSSIAYGANGLPSSTTDIDGLVTALAYDRLDRVVSSTAPATGTTTFTLDAAGRTTATTDADGAVETVVYTQSGLLAEVKRGPYTMLRRTYDAAGRTTQQLASGVLTASTYDSLDRLLQRGTGLDPQTLAASVTEVFTYDSADRVVTRTLTPTANGTTTTTFTYDPWGRLATASDVDRGQAKVKYDVANHVRLLTDGEGYSREIRYDSRGRPIHEDLPGRGHVERSYLAPATFGASTGLSRVTDVDADGFATDVYTDALGRAVVEIAQDGTYVERQFAGSHLTEERWRDAAGTLLRKRTHQHHPTTGLRTTSKGPATTAELSAGTEYRLAWTYSPAGRVLTAGPPDDLTGFTYSNGFPVTEAFSGLTRTLTRADLERPWVTQESLLGGSSTRTTQIQRDFAGRLTQEVITASGHSITRTFGGYDAFGKPSQTAAYYDGALEASDLLWFDQAGRPTRREAYLSGVFAGETKWEWFKNGALKAQRTPSGKWMAYDYGASFDHLLDRVHDRAGTDFAVFNTRNGRGQPTSVALIGTALSLQYDERGRLEHRASTSAANGNTTWDATFDALGLLRGEHHTDGATTWDNTFDYDGAGRLTHESRGRTAEAFDYVLDRAGNRLQTLRSVNGGAPAVTMTASYAGTKLTSVTTNGVTKNLGYNPWREVVSDQNNYTYQRGPDGRTRSITAGATVTYLTRDAAGVPVAIDEGGTYDRLITRGLDPNALPIEVSQANGNPVSYVEAGGLFLARVAGANTAVELFDSAGSVSRYKASALDHGTSFGANVTPPAGNDERYLFAGMERLPGAPQIELAQHREYDPMTGRFLSPDPIGLSGGWHRTLYADGNPAQKRDPQGLSSVTMDGATLDYVGFMGLRPGEPYVPSAPQDAGMGKLPDFQLTFGAGFTMRPCFPSPTGSLGYIDNGSTDIDGVVATPSPQPGPTGPNPEPAPEPAPKTEPDPGPTAPTGTPSDGPGTDGPQPKKHKKTAADAFREMGRRIGHLLNPHHGGAAGEDATSPTSHRPRGGGGRRFLQHLRAGMDNLLRSILHSGSLHSSELVAAQTIREQRAEATRRAFEATTKEVKRVRREQRDRKDSMERAAGDVGLDLLYPPRVLYGRIKLYDTLAQSPYDSFQLIDFANEYDAAHPWAAHLDGYDFVVSMDRCMHAGSCEMIDVDSIVYDGHGGTNRLDGRFAQDVAEQMRANHVSGVDWYLATCQGGVMYTTPMGVSWYPIDVPQMSTAETLAIGTQSLVRAVRDPSDPFNPVNAGYFGGPRYIDGGWTVTFDGRALNVPTVNDYPPMPGSVP